jgi:uncharacterized protein
MSRLKILVSKFPGGLFLVLTFIISYLFGLAFNALIDLHFSFKNEIIDTYLSRLFTVYGPAIAAIIITYLYSGRADVLKLTSRIIPTKSQWKYLIIIPFITLLISIGALWLAGLELSSNWGILSDNLDLLLYHLLAQIFIISIGEEIGWRAWLLPNLMKKYTLVKATFILIPIWGLWHFPVFFQNPDLIPSFLYYWIGSSLIFSWFWYKQKGNIALIIMGHAALNAPFFLLANKIGLNGLSQAILNDSFEIAGAFYLLIGLAIMIFNWKTFSTFSLEYLSKEQGAANFSNSYK